MDAKLYKPTYITIKHEGRYFGSVTNRRPIDSWTASVYFENRLKVVLTRWLNDRYRHRGWLSFDEAYKSAMEFCAVFGVQPNEWVETVRTMGNPEHGLGEQVWYAAYQRKGD